MALRTLGSYSADPNAQVNSLRNFGLVMASLTQSWRDRQDKQQQRDLQQIRYLLGLAQQEPELASNPKFYADVTKRYSKNFPEVAPLLDTLKSRGAVLEQAKSAGTKFLQMQGEMQQVHDALQQQLATSEDTLPNGAPNLDKAILRGQLMQIGDPASFSTRAMQRLSPQERSGAALYQKMGGYQMPHELDPYKDFTPSGKTLFAGQTGALDPNSPTYRAAEYQAGLKLSPVKALEIVKKEEEERAKAKASMDLEDARFRHGQQGRRETAADAAQRLLLSDKLSRGRMQLGVDTYEQKFDYAHPDGPADPNRVTYKDIVQGVSAAQQDYDARLRQALQGAPKGQAGQIKAAFFQQYGSRPSPIPPSHAKVLALRAESAGADDPEAAQQALSGMVSNYQALRAAGKSQVDALHAAQPGAPALTPPPAPAPGMSAAPKPAAGPGLMDTISSWFHSAAPLNPAGLAGAAGGVVPHPSGPGAAPAPQIPSRQPGSVPPQSGAQAPAVPQGQPSMQALLGATADTLRSHGPDYARQILATHYGIQGAQADQLLHAAQIAASQRSLASQPSAIDEPDTGQADEPEQ